MIRIMFYEGNHLKEERIAQEFSRIFNELRLSYELHIILHPEQLLPIVQKDPFRYDILCLSLECSSLTEKVLFCLREYNQLSDVILLDGTVESFRRVIKYRPSEWISSEELLSGKLLSTISYRCILLQKSRNQSFFIRTKTRIIRIPYTNINFFESVQRQVILHGTEEGNNFAFLAKLDDVDSKLPKNIFCRCHKSLIINLNNVKALDKSMKQFVLNNGQEVDISKAHYRDVIEIYERYITNI